MCTGEGFSVQMGVFTTTAVGSSERVLKSAMYMPGVRIYSIPVTVTVTVRS